MAKFESYLPTILNTEIATDDLLLTSDKSNTYKTRALTFEELDKRYVKTAGGSIVTGNIAASTFSGNGAALTGITGATGGVANEGNTTIGADTNDDDTGVIALQTKLLTRMTIANAGNVGIGVTDPDTKLEVLHAGNQLKLSFDGTDNATFGVDTSGDLTITPSGTKVEVAGKLFEEGTQVTSKVEFETSSDLVFNVASVTTATATFSRMSLLDSNYIPKYLTNKTLTWDITTDLVGGAELASTWYGAWLDSDEVTKLAPDLTGTADGNTDNKLIDSAADWVTYLVQVGDELYNLDDLTMGYVGAVDDLNTISCVDGDGNALDLFPDGNEDYRIVMLSPPGLGANRERIGAVYNNAGSDLDDSIYTQQQYPKIYDGNGGDFTITGADSWSTIAGTAWGRPFNIGYQWFLEVAYGGTSTATTNSSSAIGGIISIAAVQAIGHQSDTGSVGTTGTIDASSATVRMRSSGNIINHYIHGTIKIAKKPTWAN